MFPVINFFLQIFFPSINFYVCSSKISHIESYYIDFNKLEDSQTVKIPRPHWPQFGEYQTFDKKDQWIDILGKAPFKQGLDEMKLRPGVYAKGGMVFEIGTSRLRAQSNEGGAMVEYYPQGIPLMAENPPSYIIPTLYLSYSGGSRFKKY